MRSPRQTFIEKPFFVSLLKKSLMAIAMMSPQTAQINVCIHRPIG